MKVAYVFSTSGHTASYKLGRMILPQLERGTHGADVIGMFFFDDNTYLLRAGDPLGERLGRVAGERGMLLMLCDQCALERGWPRARSGRRRRWTPSTAFASGAFPTCTPRWRAIPPTTSSRCSFAALRLESCPYWRRARTSGRTRPRPIWALIPYG